MPFELIKTPPPKKIFRHLRRKLTRLFGVILFLTGLAASSLPLLLIVVLIVSMLSPRFDVPDMDSEQAALFLGATLIAIVGLVLGLKLIRGRRRLVLFLRRFGYDEATAALSFAAASAMGQRWRLVTLDDSEIAPILGIKAQGRILGLLRWLLLAAVVAGLFWLFGDGFSDYLGEFVDGLKRDNRGGGLEAVIGQIVVIFIMTIVVGAIVGSVVLMLVALLGAGMLFSWRSFRSYKKAELGKTRSIESTDRIEPVVETVLRLSRKVFAPRLVVVRVDSGIWKKVVMRFADVSAVILVDVSSPGEGLLWELEKLKLKHYKKIVLVGQYDALEKLSAWSVAVEEAVDTEQRLAILLDGESVLAYHSDSSSDTRRFTRLLKARLNDLY